MSDPAETAENWRLICTPLGEEWSGRARYAAAMYFYQKGLMSAEALEIYRVCARLDAQDPLAILRERGIGSDWIEQLERASARWGTGER